MNKYHAQILTDIKKAQKTDYKYKDAGKYHGTTRKFYGLNSAAKSAILKNFYASNKELGFEEYVELVTSLYLGESFEEKTLAGVFLEKYESHRKALDPNVLDVWLDNLEGWAEIDCTCQSAFTGEEMLTNWSAWHEVLSKFAESECISKRRASLVLLTKPTKYSTDNRISKLAFENIEKLKHEKDILITKAISWLLRSMVKNYRDEVKRYLDEQKNTLPKIAVRETSNKLATGRKS